MIESETSFLYEKPMYCKHYDRIVFQCLENFKLNIFEFEKIYGELDLLAQETFCKCGVKTNIHPGIFGLYCKNCGTVFGNKHEFAWKNFLYDMKAETIRKNILKERFKNFFGYIFYDKRMVKDFLFLKNFNKRKS